MWFRVSLVEVRKGPEIGKKNPACAECGCCLSVCLFIVLYVCLFLCVCVVSTADNLSEALKTLKLSSAGCSTDALEGCLDCLLKALADNSESQLSTINYEVTPRYHSHLTPLTSDPTHL